MSQLLVNVLSGSYTFERIVSSPHMRFNGNATFLIGNDNQILYREDGQYRMEDIEQTGYQKRIFIIEATQLSIYKSDNSLLHTFKMDNLQTFPVQLNHMHQCMDDRYSLTMDIHSNDSFRTLYVIGGPRKDYKIETVYTRIELTDEEAMELANEAKHNTRDDLK